MIATEDKCAPAARLICLLLASWTSNGTERSLLSTDIRFIGYSRKGEGMGFGIDLKNINPFSTDTSRTEQTSGKPPIQQNFHKEQTAKSTLGTFLPKQGGLLRMQLFNKVAPGGASLDKQSLLVNAAAVAIEFVKSGQAKRFLGRFDQLLKQENPSQHLRLMQSATKKATQILATEYRMTYQLTSSVLQKLKDMARQHTGSQHPQAPQQPISTTTSTTTPNTTAINETPVQNTGISAEASADNPAKLSKSQIDELRTLYHKHLANCYSDGAMAEAKIEFLEKFPKADGREIKRELRAISVENGAIPENAPIPEVTTDSTGFPTKDVFDRLQFMTYDEVWQRSAQNSEPPKQVPDQGPSPSLNASGLVEPNTTWYDEAFKPLSGEQTQILQQMYAQALQRTDNDADWARTEAMLAYSEKYPKASFFFIGQTLDKLLGKAT